jgi:ABC-type transporter Mla subunit MlaD
VGLGLGVVGVFAVGSRGWFGSNALHVRAGFPEIRGVEVGTPVRIQGISAGEVVGITPPNGPDSPVMLRMRIKNECRQLVRVSSTVQIVGEGMLGAKVIEIRPPVRRAGQAEPDLSEATDDLILVSERTTELTDVVGQVGEAVKGLAEAKGSIAEFGSQAMKLLKTSNKVAEQSKDFIDGAKRLPIIRNYIQDPAALLIRTGSERNRKVFAENDLFEPGRSVLTPGGKDKLRSIGEWANQLKHSGSDVVVVAYADPAKPDPNNLAGTISSDQAKTVTEHLKSQYRIHKIGSWFNPVSERKVTPLGMGTTPPPEAEPADEAKSLPAARVEIIVFVPQK